MHRAPRPSALHVRENSPSPRPSYDSSATITISLQTPRPDSPPRARSSSDVAVTAPRPPTRFLSHSSSTQAQDSLAPTPASTELHGASAKFGFLREKLSSSLAHHSKGSNSHHTATPVPSSTTQHSASSSTLALPTTLASVPSIGSLKTTSPSKPAPGRIYDSKLVSREMHRLAHPLTGLAPALTPSASSMSLPLNHGQAQATAVPSSNSDPWGALHVHVLPLFNGEPLRIPIEDLNVLVKKHVSSVVSSSPSKALSTLEFDAKELIASGMVTLNRKLMDIDDEKLLGRVVEIWGFFWDQVLTYVEGVLLPLQTDPILLSLYRNPKRPSSPTSRPSGPKPSLSSSNNGSLGLSSPYHIDVRTVALQSFRDRVIVPLYPRIHAKLSGRQESLHEPTYQQPRLQQMLLVLASQGRQQAPAVSLTSPPPQPSSGETAVNDLLRALRSPKAQDRLKGSSTTRNPAGSHTRAPSFLSGGLPRDRRGRIAQKQGTDRLPVSPDTDDLDEGSYLEKDPRAALEALKSPDLEATHQRASTGGWGLGAGPEVDNGDEEEDEPLDWDQAQAVVERMVGMASVPPGADGTSRRRQ